MTFAARTHSSVLLAALAALSLTACGKQNGGAPYAVTALTPATHLKFPIATGVHALDCAACHGTLPSFKQFDCLGCHTQPPTAAVHLTTSGYTYDTLACYRCHADPTTHPFDHVGVTTCAGCHSAGNFYAALPRPGFTHMDMAGKDCSACHNPNTWLNVSAPGGVVSDPLVSVSVNTLVPRYSGTSIVQLSAQTQLLPMGMSHTTTEVNVAGLACSSCHLDVNAGVMYPGRLHSSLANLAQPVPVACLDCHSGSAPTGFVGPTATSPARVPPSGEMKHDAVLWLAGAPSATRVVTADCGTCHVSPTTALQATWATGTAGTSPARFHASLTAASLPQPASCVDCHANSRPAGSVAVTSGGVATGASFDHSGATGDCATCHGGSTTVWSGARFHVVGSTTPATCLPCHAGQRPTSTSGWASLTYTTSPFDYGDNSNGVHHGDGQDCVVCHAGPGTNGTWGVTQTFTGGHFAHGSTTVAAGTCITCHTTQRPDIAMGSATLAAAAVGFDHSLLGAGDCIGCHQATVTRVPASYVNYYSPSAGNLPGGDWRGGSGYPGGTLVSAVNQFITITEIALQRTTPGGLVTGMTSIQDTLYNAMLHTSPQVPAAISAGTSNAGDPTKCAYCHATSPAGVLSFPIGQFHSALTAFPVGLGGPLAQPTACLDCHAQMRPPGVVELGGSDLQPMDHAALFTAPTSIGGHVVSGVNQLDCATCHHSPGVSWSGGNFHASIGSAIPADCAVCHYPLMADGAKANLTSGTNYAMAHGSTQLTFQNCGTCHTSALTAATAPTLASTTWNPGSFHGSLPASSQPTACIDCHMVSEPAANASTQSSVIYTLTLGGTSTNGGQWMNHGVASVAGLDCAACHRSDAKPSGSAWNRGDLLHTVVPNPTTCNGCHGLTNGGGSVPGTNNNMPAGLTNSSTLTTASADSTTGVPTGTYDQITHTDVNVTAQACNFCHTQVGISTATGIAGKEWAQARFHASFTAATPLLINTTTGRCSNCHMNVKPLATFTAQDHSAFTNVSGSQDCSACHSWPGTGGTTTPNWLGGGNMPQFITVGGFAIPNPPATTATTQTGIANLPHPTPTATMTCATCHSGGAGGKHAIGYDHASALANSACSACHEAGSNLVGTVWNGATTQAAGAGDTRPTTITSLKATRGNGGSSCTLTVPNHFYSVQCGQCHSVPTGTGPATTGTAYTSAWTFPHSTSKMTNPSTCNLCHSQAGCPKD
jgi:hypothetical protein